ncbi:MAG: 30S ribosomal protein S24e [Candidatus Thermoplasmatota archaeon]|jgi:small subunit ribosomal protein S24e|nr:30S ribosomal protein S24e [Candidatus Thermoplasmatota archaeon]MCL5791144.1 30S ribosomal protein S24e [Candidatus Thermoplasmatota archaeon]
MNFKIVESKENKILKRKEIKYTLEYENSPTPSREVIKEIIARNTNSNKDLVIVDKNLQKTGLHLLEGYSKIYSKKEDAMLYEPDYELFRNGLKTKEAKQ